MALAYIDATGLHLPDYPTILGDLKTRMRAIFGDDLYLEPDSQEGQLLAVFALAIHDAYSLAGSVYNAYSPHTAQGAGLSRMVVINGIRRQTGTRSTAELCIVGQAGTVIRNGVATDTASRRWLLPDEVVIPLSGEVTVTATAAEAGDLRAAPGEIAVIGTPCRGWQSVTNPAAATPGAAVETDAALRQRQRVSTALPSRSVFDGTVGAVASVTGVTRWAAYENDSGQIDAHGLPPHSIALVVEGGDAREIAEAIAAKKTPGTGTAGDTAVTTLDTCGVPNVIRFYRPVPVPVRALVVVKPLAGYLSTTGERVRQAVADAINALAIGEDVLLSRLFTPINAADADGGRTFDVVSLALASGDAEPAAANVAVAFNAVASCRLEDVSLEVRG